MCDKQVIQQRIAKEVWKLWQHSLFPRVARILEKATGSSTREHLTAWHQIENLSLIHKNILSKKSIIIVNELSLSISHIRTVFLKTKYGTMPHIVPKLKMKLISIQSMTKDLHCNFVLNEPGFQK